MNGVFTVFAASFFFSLLAAPALALAPEALCPKWLPAVKQGELDSRVIDESSGLSISRTQNSFYHMKDSGTPPEFHITAPDGSNLRTVHIEDYTPVDPEETSMGPCPLSPHKTCLVIDDIGDNLKRRKSIAFFFLEEVEPWPKSVRPAFVARFKYPDGAHNAEAATVLDNGDIVIFTKELTIVGSKASPAGVYRATRKEVLTAAKDVITLAKIGTLDLPKITKQDGLFGVATGIAAVSSGKRFTILTYNGAFEFAIDLKQPKFPSVIVEKDYRSLPVVQLPQQESIAYDRGDRDLVYSTEIKLTQRFFGKGTPAPLYKVKCSL